MIRKVILTVACVGVIVTTTVLGTLAYLIDTDEAVNTFTVGKVDIVLNEAAVDEKGQLILGEDSMPVERVQGNEYHLIPGQTYIKDPTVTVKNGSEESYVRMMVSINCAKELKEIFGEEFLPENHVEGWDRNVWVPVSVTEDTAANTLNYEFRYYKAVEGTNEDVVLEPLFETFTIAGRITGEELEKIKELKITVTGHAIQATGFEHADAAWKAFSEQVTISETEESEE